MIRKLPERLPSLHGRRGTIAILVYAMLAFAVIGIALAETAFITIDAFRNMPANAHYGFRVFGDERSRPAVARVSAEAKAGGLAKGERILTLNGTPLRPGLTLIEFGALMAENKGDIRIDTGGDTGVIHHARLARRDDLDGVADLRTGLPLPLAGIFEVADFLIPTVILITISLLLARKRARDAEAMLLATGFLLLAYGNMDDVWLWFLHPPLSADVVGWVEELLTVLGYWAMFVGICAFPDGRFSTRWAQITLMVPTTYVIANAATNFRLWSISPLLTAALNIPIFVAVVTSMLLRFRAAKIGIERQQIKWALYGGTIMIVGAVIGFLTTTQLASGRLDSTSIFFLHALRNDLVRLAFPLGLLVSLLRYRLYDIDAVITRSTIYALLTIVLVAIFACTEKVIEVLGEEEFGHRLGALAGGLGAAVAAVMVAPLHHRISHWAEHRFRHGLIELRHGLPALIAGLRETASPTALAEAALHRIAHALHSGHGAVIDMAGNTFALHGLSHDRMAVWREEALADVSTDRTIAPGDHILPLHIALKPEGAAQAGWLLLGPRPDGSLYDKDERQTLAEIAQPLAIGLTATLHNAEATAAAESERLAMQRRVAELERALAKLTRPPE